MLQSCRYRSFHGLLHNQRRLLLGSLDTNRTVLHMSYPIGRTLKQPRLLNRLSCRGDSVKGLTASHLGFILIVEVFIQLSIAAFHDWFGISGKISS
jgi:hypothetical protein